MSQPEAPPRTASGPPPGRYGRRDPARGRRAALISAGVVVALMLSFAGWMGIREARKPLRWRAGTFTAVNDGQARLDVIVTTTPGRTAICTVRMFNLGLTEVGHLDVTLGPASQREIRVTTTVPTFELATTGDVKECIVR